MYNRIKYEIWNHMNPYKTVHFYTCSEKMCFLFKLRNALWWSRAAMQVLWADEGLLKTVEWICSSMVQFKACEVFAFYVDCGTCLFCPLQVMKCLKFTLHARHSAMLRRSSCVISYPWILLWQLWQVMRADFYGTCTRRQANIYKIVFRCLQHGTAMNCHRITIELYRII